MCVTEVSDVTHCTEFPRKAINFDQLNYNAKKTKVNGKNNVNLYSGVFVC